VTWCSALFTTLHRTLRLVRAALGSRNASLLEPLFKSGWGLELRVVNPSQGSSSSQEEQQSAELCPPLPELLVQQGECCWEGRGTGWSCRQQLQAASASVGLLPAMCTPRKRAKGAVVGPSRTCDLPV
jgi:hypothetical protein